MNYAVDETSANDLDTEKRATGVAEFLQAPRKKRKNYALLALSSQFNAELAGQIEAYIRKNHQDVTVLRTKSLAELKRFYSRQIHLIVIDDGFSDLIEITDIVKTIKLKNHRNIVPTLFLTESPSELVEIYSKELGAFHEADDYTNYVRVPANSIISRIRACLAARQQRRSRRFIFDLLSSMDHMIKGTSIPSRVLQMSMHGGIVEAIDEEFRFAKGDQLRLNIPKPEHLRPEEGNYLKVSARVQKVFLSGNKVAVSWEYLSNSKKQKLLELLLEIIDPQIYRRQLMIKAKYASMKVPE